jgi:NADH-quinone oxidoreductase subunit L
VSGFLGARWLRQQSHWPIWTGVGISAILSFALLFGMLHHWGEGEPLPAPGGGTESHQSEEGGRALWVTSHWYTWGAFGAKKNEAKEDNRSSYLEVDAGAFFDPLTATMLCVVTGVGFLITVFSKGYMAGEAGYFRFFAYLGLFIFAMTILVMGNNLIMLYLGWEGVGLCSYLLIGYYYERPSAREAAKKAFIVNRIGDFGFGIGIMLCFLLFGTVSYFGEGPSTLTGVLTKAADPNWVATHLTQPWQQRCLYWIPFCLMLGAFGKSAQFPLYVWLPDAMEGPTPVSALIHAATMVTAGVYMIVRCGTLFYGNPAALLTVAAVGCFTAIFAASIALRQFDLKKVFAYSTISQLGFMFVGVAVLAPVAGVFHLVTHAFFKALLFLSSGVVMHAMAGELDMRKMSGLRKVLPITNAVILVGCLALAGFPFFSGYFSKDEIVAAAQHRYPILGYILLVTAFMTAYYTFRLYFRVFQGPLVLPEAPAPAHAHGHEPHEHAAASHSAIETHTAPSSGVDVGQTHHAPVHAAHGHGEGHANHEPLSMMIPLIILAIGAFAAGYLNWPERVHNLGAFLGQSPSFILNYAVAHDALGAVTPGHFGQEAPGAVREPLFNWSMVIGGLVSLLGITLAAVLHWQDRPLADHLADRLGPLRRLVENKWYVDEIYQALIVEPLWTLGRVLYELDRWIVDGFINALGWIPQLTGFTLKLTVQRGYLQGYATAMVFGIMVILILVFM